MTNSTQTKQPLHFAAATELNVGDKILTGNTHATIVEMRWSRNRKAVTIDYRLDFNGNLLSIGGPASMTFRVPAPAAHDARCPVCGDSVAHSGNWIACSC